MHMYYIFQLALQEMIKGILQSEIKDVWGSCLYNLYTTKVYTTFLCFLSREDPLAFVEELVWWC